MLARLLLVGLGAGIVGGCAMWEGAIARTATGANVSQQAPRDAVSMMLAGGRSPVRTVLSMRQRLLESGGTLRPHIVANRGAHNPEAGSFSFFETYEGPMPGGQVAEGELFVGYFSEREGAFLQVLNLREPGLMVEAIAWDARKGMYNFWELTGTEAAADWHYRGDSADVLADVASINMNARTPAFGNRLRCSGCHTQGGPILKELAEPHNDWWRSARVLPLGTLKLGEHTPHAALAKQLLKEAVDAHHLARVVQGGLKRLVAARARVRQLSVKQRLRSLFGSVELNLESDVRPYEGQEPVSLPVSFFVDRRLTGAQAPVVVAAGDYAVALRRAGLRFAPGEAKAVESQHAFVVPVRSHVDNLELDQLVADGVLDEELIADVLAIDFTNPLYSRARQRLLSLVPDGVNSAQGLRLVLVEALGRLPKQDVWAQELLANLSDPARDRAFHRARALRYLTACRGYAAQSGAAFDWLRLASQRRAEVRVAETALNPRGTILEPGFRVIFPDDDFKPVPFALTLDACTGRVRWQGHQGAIACAPE